MHCFRPKLAPLTSLSGTCEFSKNLFIVVFSDYCPLNFKQETMHEFSTTHIFHSNRKRKKGLFLRLFWLTFQSNKYFQQKPLYNNFDYLDFPTWTKKVHNRFFEERRFFMASFSLLLLIVTATQHTFTCSKLTVEILEKGVKYVRS